MLWFSKASRDKQPAAVGVLDRPQVWCQVMVMA